MRFPPIAVVAVAASALAAPLYLAGWFAPAVFPDTENYMQAALSANPWGEVRHPLYGWLVQALEAAGPQRSLVPPAQYAIHVIATLALTAGSLRAGLSPAAAASLGLAGLLSQGLMIWGRAVLPEMLSVSLLTIAFAAVLGAVAGRWFVGLALLAGVATGAAYILRPIMLPAIVVLPLLHVLAAQSPDAGARMRRGLILLTALALPFFAQSIHRWKEVGDFGLVSFGGFGISGMTVQLLTPDALDRLPEAHRPLAALMLEGKDRAVAEQTAMPLFRNSLGQRSYQATALDGFDVLARNFDEIMWGKLSSLKGADESWVAFNARMGAVNGAILRALPERWALWVVGASSRLVGRLATYNAAFILAALLFGAVAVTNIARHGAGLAGGRGRSWSMLALIVVGWIISTTALSVVAAFPALRYVDTGGMLLTALPLYGLFLALRKTNEDAPA